MLGGALITKPRATKMDATTMIRSLGFGLERDAEPQPVDSAAVKLIKRGLEYSLLKNRFSGVSDAIDEALVALEHGGYIALSADYSRLNAKWNTLNDIEKRGVPAHPTTTSQHIVLTRFVRISTCSPAQPICNAMPLSHLPALHTIRESIERIPRLWGSSVTLAQPAAAATGTKSACGHDRHQNVKL